MKYICVANCPVLNDDQHCTCVNIEDAYERYADGCPCGNSPIWRKMIQKDTIIYCKDCKFLREYSDEYKSNVENAIGDCYILLMNSDNKQLIAKSKDDYCSYAKLKEK